MKTIVDIRIEPADAAKVTPHELLRDFAYAHSAWHFLEAESRHYADEKGVSACVLRYLSSNGVGQVDLVFSAEAPTERSSFHLILVAPVASEEPLNLAGRNDVLDRFLDAFSDYLEQRHIHAHLHTVEDDIEPSELSA